MILAAFEGGWTDADAEQALKETGVTGRDVAYVRSLMEHSEHMRTVYTLNCPPAD